MASRKHAIKPPASHHREKWAYQKVYRPVSSIEASGILEIYHRLYAHFGPQAWWPAETRFEVIIGAILTQNTAWTNVEKAISNLRESDLLLLEALHNCPEKDLASMIRSSGYFNQKARRLKRMTIFIFQNYEGSLDRMFVENSTVLRKALLSVNGLGPETVDSILLYAGEIPIFVIDAYTRRIFSRHHLIEEKASYKQIQDRFMEALPGRVAMFNEYHALIVKTAKIYCKKQPDCAKCPLRSLAGFKLPAV